MKFFVAFAALVAVAVALPTKTAFSQDSELQAIIAAINSPSTDPATAALLEQQLQDILGVVHPIAVGPEIIDFPVPDGGAVSAPVEVGPVVDQHPISVGPALIDFPLPEGALAPSPSPVVIGPIAPGAPAPLVQLIVNVNGASVGVDGVAAPPVKPVKPVKPSPVIIVDEADNSVVQPVQIVDVAPIVVDPVHIVDVSPIVVEPVQVGTPILPAPAVNLPDELN